jgi:hypothetical protein
MEAPSEIGQKILILKSHRTRNARLFEEADLMVRNLMLCGSEFYTCVPCTAIVIIEPAAERAGMREGGVDDIRLRHPL